jgi:hypothetical protein
MNATPAMTTSFALPEPKPTPVPRRLGLTRLLLRDPGALNEELARPERLPVRVAQLLGLSVGTFAVFGAVVGVMVTLLGHNSFAQAAPHPWASLPIVFALGLTGALGLCLPVFVFCAQVSGLDASPALVTAQALRAKATSALALAALLPAYIAVSLGALWFRVGADEAIVLGLLLPVLVGLVGITAIVRGFLDLAERQGLRHERRAGLTALVVGASAVYTLVAPVALFWLFEALWSRI